MQRPGKEQKTEHALQQGLIEIDSVDNSPRPLFREGEPELGEGDNQQRCQQRDQHQTDGGRQAYITMIDVTEYRRQGQQQGDYVEQLHQRPSIFFL